MAVIAINVIGVPCGSLLENLLFAGAMWPDCDKFCESFALAVFAFGNNGNPDRVAARQCVELSHHLPLVIVPGKAFRAALAHEHQEWFARGCHLPITDYFCKGGFEQRRTEPAIGTQCTVPGLGHLISSRGLSSQVGRLSNLFCAYQFSRLSKRGQLALLSIAGVTRGV